MGMSLKEQFARLSAHEREALLLETPPDIIEQMARGEWWWESRPEQVPSDGMWLIFLFLAGRGTGKTRSGAEWLVRRTLDHPFDTSGFPVERLVMAYNLSDARQVCIEGASGVLRVLNRLGYEEILGNRVVRDTKLKYHYTKSPKPHITILETEAKIYFTGADPDSARGYNLADVWCVAEGEPVATARGYIPVEQVTMQDHVLTESGYRAVLAASCTRKNVEVLRITTEEGDLRVTPDHVVWANEGWVVASDVVRDDTMVTCLPQVNLSPATPQPSMCGMAKPGSTTKEPSITTAGMDHCCTDACGSPPMGPFQPDTKCTTSTDIDGIIDWKICDCSPLHSIAVSPLRNAPMRRGQAAPSDPNVVAEDCGKCGKSGSPKRSSALNVENLTFPRECGLNGALPPVATLPAPVVHETSVLHVERESNKYDVYDLTIEGEHHFFAGSGGIKIHNCDEIVKWPDPSACWKEGIMPALRADLPHDKPRAFVTTTPKPIAILQQWLQEYQEGSSKISLSRGSTFDNALNLSQDFLEEVSKAYEGTALGRQELYGEMLDALEGALFSYSAIEQHRVEIGPQRVAHRTVGVDPGLTGAEDGDEMGVVVASRDLEDHIFVLADRTTKMAGRDAALYAWRIFEEFHCDTLVYESNLGKAWMEQVFTDAYAELQRAGVFPADTTPPLVAVFSNQGKKLRAEPVAMRYSQGRIHHIGRFEELEKQMLSFDPLRSKASPDRLDALVHACRHLMEGEKRRSRVISPLSHRIAGPIVPVPGGIMGPF